MNNGQLFSSEGNIEVKRNVSYKRRESCFDESMDETTDDS